MEEVLTKLGSTTITNPQDQNKTSFDTLYKNWGRLGNQEERRKDLLDFQKRKRQSNLDDYRGILQLVNAIEQQDLFGFKIKHSYRPSIYVAGFHKVSPSYKDVLMLSEWMIEKPEDFESNWYVVPCPKGTRMLLVATQGRTKFYTKYGQFRFEMRTALPGGNPIDGKKRRSCCVLDCFYVEKINTMFVVDLLAWNNQPMTDGETEFRHYWLTSQFSELEGLDVINKKNQIIIKLLPKISCAKESFTKFMMTFPHFNNNFPPMDGLLFYHKKAQYFSGETPLVGWLFPYMVPEIIDQEITIHQVYMLEKPESYTNQTEFIQLFEKKYAKKNTRSKRNSKDTAMESSDCIDEQNGGRDKENSPKVEVMEAEANAENSVTSNDVHQAAPDNKANEDIGD